MTPVFVAGSAENAIVENTSTVIGIFTHDYTGNINNPLSFNMMQVQLFEIFSIPNNEEYGEFLRYHP
jgi:methyltransferase-like protein